MRHCCLIAVCCLAALAAAGCDRFMFQDDPILGRVVLGEGIDDLPLGVDTFFVYRRLGEPGRIVRLPGSIRYVYEHGEHAGLEALYTVLPGRTVQKENTLLVRTPYVGRTKGGIGLGTARGEVIAQLGQPQSSTNVEAGVVVDAYVQGTRYQLAFRYRNERLEVLSMTGGGAGNRP